MDSLPRSVLMCVSPTFNMAREGVGNSYSVRGKIRHVGSYQGRVHDSEDCEWLRRRIPHGDVRYRVAPRIANQRGKASVSSAREVCDTMCGEFSSA